MGNVMAIDVFVFLFLFFGFVDVLVCHSIPRFSGMAAVD